MDRGGMERQLRTAAKETRLADDVSDLAWNGLLTQGAQAASSGHAERQYKM
jgi:hypothetical protein